MSLDDFTATEYGVTLSHSTKPATEEQVAAFEGQLGARLPDDYRAFLLEHNGGRPRPSGFRMAVRTGAYTDSLVDTLFSLVDEGACTLEKYKRTLRTRAPAGVVPIGDDPFGNFICLVVSGHRRGQVWFWDHEREVDPPADWSNMDLVAASFDDFMEGLEAEV